MSLVRYGSLSDHGKVAGEEAPRKKSEQPKREPQPQQENRKFIRRSEISTRTHSLSDH
ncbi:hypothetical protein Q7M76_00410 [Candidatus Liberibacter asiaticus]|uniref:Uncharacterized protein n=2 Tax=Liberibacter asiaticus TaxID=34021 RepID=C6XHE0_LIBAP|nr:hypothetical protein [Candidatus Liberibacter asiaticus]ACT56683.1 hypothetical protein CLIBASIA_00475 [Candidatus Liberibacter asiaticus str. psy62]AGH16451.1 hypothetical protein WSI_00380 [Candidatus Liberibacter asiaticus str. gxpsy]MBA2916990.1 hypothetical protein [Candidatus Liberibacter asiaticus]MBE2996119.1 hypothetical protein [Candidatus Liberibacter asiaticus]MCU7488238.1 hypothetical protein [Candidatus Liberibacter asiaticus]